MISGAISDLKNNQIASHYFTKRLTIHKSSPSGATTVRDIHNKILPSRQMSSTTSFSIWADISKYTLELSKFFIHQLMHK
jgi:hypothetical protein